MLLDQYIKIPTPYWINVEIVRKSSQRIRGNKEDMSPNSAHPKISQKHEKQQNSKEKNAQILSFVIPPPLQKNGILDPRLIQCAAYFRYTERRAFHDISKKKKKERKKERREEREREREGSGTWSR